MDPLKKLLKRLKELLAEQRGLLDIAETDEQFDRLEALNEEIPKVERQIDVLQRAEETRAAESRINHEPEIDGAVGGDEQRSGVERVEDHPVYRGPHALGEQMRDIVRASNPTIRDTRAASRLQEAAQRSVAAFRDGDEDRGIENRAAGTGGHVESIGADGGFLLQSETAIDLMTKGFNNSEVLKRCQKRTLTTTNKMNIIGIDETSRADGSRGGGIRIYTTAELETMTQSKTKFAKIAIEPKKLTGLFYASDEMLEDAPFLAQELEGLFGDEFAFKGQNLVLRGSGVGEPLGILNAGCLVSQAKETSQTAATINTSNVLKMDSRIWNDSAAGVVWLVNRECKPQLATMVITAGDTNALLYKTFQNQGVKAASLNGAPCVTIEQASALGTVGDIILADFGQYVTANKGGINSAMSIHLKFDYNQTAFRFTYRFDGQPRWTSALTPYKGSATVSPFVVLATRA